MEFGGKPLKGQSGESIETNVQSIEKKTSFTDLKFDMNKGFSTLDTTATDKKQGATRM